MSSEGVVDAWARLGWPLMVAFTLSLVLVALLRRPCRWAFGMERACQLWFLPLFAMLASQLPHPATPFAVLPHVFLKVAGAAHGLRPVASVPIHVGAPMVLFALWLLGTLIAGARAWLAQRQYGRALEGAQRLRGLELHWPVWRSRETGIGPATVGAWRPCIVLPADFERRYDQDERALILAHEACHARRGDGRWMLCAQLIAAMAWFHPLAWWALRAMRHDQELACDASVLRDRNGQRRIYAQAMLKTQSAAFALPVGCCWQARHPIAARIAMLNRVPTGSGRRCAGAAVLVSVAITLAGVVYAGNQPSIGRAAPAQVDRYLLSLELGLDGKPARLHATSCLGPGQHYEAIETLDGALPPWDARFSVVRANQGMLQIRAQVSGGALDHVVYPKLLARPGQPATIEIGRQGHDTTGRIAANHTLRAELTATVGC